MNTDRYHFKLGDFDCLAICDVTSAGGNSGWFPNIPADISRPFLEKMRDNPDDFTHDMTCLAVNTGSAWVLLDTGMGFVLEDAKLAQILAEENIQTQHIIITHLDLDHYAGLVTSEQKPAFPKAQIHICREAWSLFTSPAFYEETTRVNMTDGSIYYLSKIRFSFVTMMAKLCRDFG